MFIFRHFPWCAMFCEKLQHVLAQPSRDFVPCACWIARCEFWYRSRNPFGTSCVSDHSCCGAVCILISLARPSRCFARVGLPWFWRSAHFSWFLEILAKRSFESLRSFYDSLGEALKILVKSFEGVPTRSRASPCEKIFGRSCGNFLFEVLVFSSWRCHVLVLVWKFFWDVHRKFLYEDLVRSCTSIYIEGPAAALAIISNFICYCSIATVACMWYTGVILSTPSNSQAIRALQMQPLGCKPWGGGNRCWLCLLM